MTMARTMTRYARCVCRPRVAILASLAGAAIVSLGLAGSIRREPAARDLVGQRPAQRTPERSPDSSPRRLLECARAIQLHEDHGVYVSGYRWTNDLSLVEAPESREWFWALGLIGSPEDVTPIRFEEAEVIETVLDRLDRPNVRRAQEHRAILQALAGPGHTIRGSALVAWLDAYCVEFHRRVNRTGALTP